MEEATNQFENLQKLFDYMNSREDWDVNVNFGTLADYFEAVKKSNKKFPVLTGDFFTYADRQSDFWSGYFVSRSFWKYMDRQLEAMLRAAEILKTTGKYKKI